MQEGPYVGFHLSQGLSCPPEPVWYNPEPPGLSAPLLCGKAELRAEETSGTGDRGCEDTAFHFHAEGEGEPACPE